MTVEYDISESFPINISQPAASTAFELKDIAYDFVIDNIPFLSRISNQDKYVRQTAAYKKEQFDNSAEPGEQSLTGWWLRSQLSFHNGAGIKFYEPGTDAAHSSHRFADSRGVNIWDEGEAKPLKTVVHAYSGAAHNLCGTAIKTDTSNGNGGYVDGIITGDSAGELKKIKLNGDLDVSTDGSYVSTYTLEANHTSSHPFYSVTSDGTHYYALCSKALHKGNVNGSTGDIVVYGNQTFPVNSFVKYAKGYVFFSNGRNLYRANTGITASSGHSSGTPTMPSGVDIKTHSSADWVWNDLASGTTHLYASGNNGNVSEIWSIAFDATGSDSGQTATSLPNLPGATMSAQLPYGEVINTIEYYLGYLVIGTSKGIRIAQTGVDGDIAYGPLLFENGYGVNGIEAIDRFAYCSTKVDGADGYTNACLVRVDLSQQFDDGTFAYAYDLEYESSLEQDNSEAYDVFLVDGRLVMLVEENDGTYKGELQVESVSTYRSSAWLETGLIRFGTVEPKYFRSVSVKCETGTGDSIYAEIIDQNNNKYGISEITTGLSNYDNIIETPVSSQERVSLKFTFNNATTDTALPTLRAWQIKAVPAVRRQRMIQIPLSCFDIEMDRFNKEFGYPGRASSVLQRLELLEETGKFIQVTDFRTNEIFTGVIEEVQFLGESSPDKNSDNFGGIVTVTIRKI